MQRVRRRHGLKRRQGHLPATRAYTRALDRHFAAAQHDFTRHTARSRGLAIRLVGIPRPANRDAVLFQHRGEDLHARSDRQLQQLGTGVDEEIDQRFIAALRSKKAEDFASLPAERLESGTGELRSWTAAAGALEGLDLSFMEYYPCYRSPAGTGVAMGFALWN